MYIFIGITDCIGAASLCIATGTTSSKRCIAIGTALSGRCHYRHGKQSPKSPTIPCEDWEPTATLEAAVHIIQGRTVYETP